MLKRFYNRLKKYREEQIIKKLKTVTHPWWNIPDSPAEDVPPLNKELFEQLLNDFNKKPPKFLYFVRKTTIFEKIWHKVKKCWGIDE